MNGITYDTLTLAGCIDCVMVLANGPEDEDGHNAANAMAHKWGHDVRHLVNACTEECEAWFSMDDCDVCGSTLGGDRHPVVLVRPKCAVCDEWVRAAVLGDPARSWGGSYAHMDGQPLCPVMGPSGYVPADHPSLLV